MARGLPYPSQTEKQTTMIDLKKEMKALKNKAKKLMSLGKIEAYLKTLNEINAVELQLIKVRS